MDEEFDFDGKRNEVPPSSKFETWDLFSIVLLAITGCVALYFLLIYFNPGSSLNLFPPAARGTTLPALPVPSTQPSSSPAVNPPAEVSGTDTPLPPNRPEMPFSVSSITAVRSTFVPHLQEQGCAWFGVAGTVEDANNIPLVGIVIRLAGTLGGHDIELTTVSGVSPNYGKSGFEFVLGDVPLNSHQEIYVQLLDQVDLPLSEKVLLSTYTDCERNLILVRLRGNR